MEHFSTEVGAGHEPMRSHDGRCTLQANLHEQSYDMNHEQNMQNTHTITQDAGLQSTFALHRPLPVKFAHTAQEDLSLRGLGLSLCDTLYYNNTQVILIPLAFQLGSRRAALHAAAAAAICSAVSGGWLSGRWKLSPLPFFASAMWAPSPVAPGAPDASPAPAPGASPVNRYSRSRGLRSKRQMYL